MFIIYTSYLYFLFHEYRSKEFIDVRCIDHCVGFAKIDNRYFIIDKENTFDDADWENL